MRCHWDRGMSLSNVIRTVLGLAVPCLIWVCVSGCGKTSSAPEIVPASGTVLLNGQPVEGVNVLFYPEKGPQVSIGTTNDEGIFQLTTLKPQDGAYVGPNRVSLDMGTSLVRRDGKPLKPEDKELLSKPTSPGVISMRFKRVKNSVVDEKYSDPRTSGLVFEVEPNGRNSFDILLTE